MYIKWDGPQEIGERGEEIYLSGFFDKGQTKISNSFFSIGVPFSFPN